MLLLSLPVMSQENNGVYAMQESLEETKKEINILEEKIPLHDYYENTLNKYIKEINDFETDIITKSLLIIEGKAGQQNETEIRKACEAITDELEKMPFSYRQLLSAL